VAGYLIGLSEEIENKGYAMVACAQQQLKQRGATIACNPSLQSTIVARAISNIL